MIYEHNEHCPKSGAVTSMLRLHQHNATDRAVGRKVDRNVIKDRQPGRDGQNTSLMQSRTGPLSTHLYETGSHALKLCGGAYLCTCLMFRLI